VLHAHERDVFDVGSWQALLLVVSFALDEVCAVVVVAVAVAVPTITKIKEWILWCC
jgi:hypothetical protein